MKKIIALLFIPVLILSMMVPAFANWPPSAPVYGNKIGWNYAVISETGSGGWKAKKDKDEDALSKKITVSCDNKTWTRNNPEYTLDNSSDRQVTITCDKGYYIAYVALCCDDDKGYDCQTFERGNSLISTYNSTMTSVNIQMQKIYSYACHASKKETYWLMIMLEKNPEPVYLQYSAGEILSEGKNVLESTAAIDETTITGATWDVKTKAYSFKACYEHTVLGIGAAAEKVAADNGYAFNGWKLEFYKDSKFEKKLDIDDEIDEEEKITLYTHARLTAQWKKIETRTITVNKAWVDEVETHSDITVTVSGGDKKYTLILGDGNGWSNEVVVPLLDSDGHEITYTVSEDITIDDYTTVVTGDMEKGFTVTNTKKEAPPVTPPATPTDSKPESKPDSKPTPSSSRPSNGPVRKIVTPEVTEENPNTGASPAIGISISLVALCAAAAFAINKMKR